MQSTIQWLVQRWLLANSSECCTCNRPRVLVRDGCRDSMRWTCSSCRSSRSICDESFFSRSQLSLTQILHSIYFWCRGDLLQTCSFQTDDMCRQAQTDCGRKCHDLCLQWLEEHPMESGGYRLDAVVAVIASSLLLPSSHRVGVFYHLLG